MSAASSSRILTVGHSVHELERFVDLLAQAGVRHVVDVRTRPYSGMAPQFNREALARTLAQHRIGYEHQVALGGRPADDDAYRADGRPIFARMAGAADLERALDALVGRATHEQVAIMCSEEDPAICHRHRLLGVLLAERGAAVEHLRADGTVEGAGQVDGRVAPVLRSQWQDSLF